jgi:hypothetical protein
MVSTAVVGVVFGCVDRLVSVARLVVRPRHGRVFVRVSVTLDRLRGEHDGMGRGVVDRPCRGPSSPYVRAVLHARQRGNRALLVRPGGFVPFDDMMVVVVVIMLAVL